MIIENYAYFDPTGTIKVRDANRGKGLEKKKCRKSVYCTYSDMLFSND